VGTLGLKDSLNSVTTTLMQGLMKHPDGLEHTQAETEWAVNSNRADEMGSDEVNMRANVDLGWWFQLLPYSHVSYREGQGLAREHFHCIDLSEINFGRVPGKGSIAD
jgi:hypothetical protein